MSALVQTKVSAPARVPPVFSAPQPGLLQRKCACGNKAGFSDECDECKKKRLGLQPKLTVNQPGDLFEQEADRVAEQVLAAPTHSDVRAAPPRIQRFAGPAAERTGGVPASVEKVLANPGRPLEPALRQDMEQRFGHDFSRVRVHSGAAAEQSAQAVNAQAYTVGHDLVFDAGRFAPGTQAGRRLIAHELTHVVQQGNFPTAVQRTPASGGGTLSLTIGDVDIKSNDPNCAYQKGEVDRSNSAKGFLDYDIEKAEFFGMNPADAVVIADFRVDDGKLRPETERDFRKFWLPMFDKSTLGSLEIIGFNDCVGWESRNQVLREERAQAVARLLPGVPASAAAGNEYPVPNTSEHGRALNRSVIIRPKKTVPPPPPSPKPHEVTIKKEEPDTKNCSADQRDQLSIAFPAAKLMAQRAQAAVANPDKGSVITFLLERYFGPDAMSHLPEIHAGFTKILSSWKDWDSRFDCEKQDEAKYPNDDPHLVTFAYATRKRHIFSAPSPYGTIHVCEAAFNNPNNLQALSATILHELSHRLDNTDDRKYCWESAGWCADLSTKAAIDNADSYAEFAREYFNTSM